MSIEQIESQIRFEIQQIDKLFDIYGTLLTSCGHKEPDLVEITAMASVLHSFYNGLEKLFEIIAKRIDDRPFLGEQWHKNLLSEMATPTPRRNPVISEGLKEKLVGYLGFRHFFRHSYSFFLEWEELNRLVIPLDEVWNEVKMEVESFLKKIKEGGHYR